MMKTLVVVVDAMSAAEHGPTGAGNNWGSSTVHDISR